MVPLGAVELMVLGSGVGAHGDGATMELMGTKKLVVENWELR